MCRIFRRALPVLQNARPALFLVVAASILSLLPDLDSIVGVASGDFGRFHNNITHSFAFGAMVALLVATLMVFVEGKRAGVAWFLFAFVCYSLHVVMDYFTAGRGVMALWPFLPDRFGSPVCLFRGVKWATGLWSSQHLLTIMNELIFVAALALAMAVIVRFRRTESKD